METSGSSDRSSGDHYRQCSKIAGRWQARLRGGHGVASYAGMRVDLRLYVIIDPEHAGGHALPDLARRVAEGGATLVQLRDKRPGTREMVAEARAIKAALTPSGVPFIVNDRVDVALAAGADGV